MRASVFFGILLWLALAAACAPVRVERVREAQRPVKPQEVAEVLDGRGGEDEVFEFGRWIAASHAAGEGPQRRSESTLAGERVRVRFVREGKFDYAPGYFDRLELADTLRISNLECHRESGAGLAMVGWRDNRGTDKLDRFYPPEGIARAVTAVPEVKRGADGLREVEVRLIDRLRQERLEGTDEVLAGAFSASWGTLLAETGELRKTALTSVFLMNTGREAGFFLMEAYAPEKTPLILVHGLFGTPLAWVKVTNELWAVPEVRERYQIWHYLYPTNVPALYSGRVMRRQLDELRAMLDPQQNDPAMKRTVIIAHSMGGLLSKSLVVEPRDAFWDAVFTKPLEEIEATPEEKKVLREAFFWEPRRHVDRVIFCCVPFRGSSLAASWLGTFGRLITAPSEAFQGFYRALALKNPGLFQPEYRTLIEGKETSIPALSPRNRSLEIFSRMPIIQGAKAHVIQGSWDWIVPESSSSLSEAESTLEVSGGHGAFQRPDAVAEMVRILKLE